MIFLKDATKASAPVVAMTVIIAMFPQNATFDLYRLCNM